MNLKQLLFDEMKLLAQSSRVMRVVAFLLALLGALNASAQTNAPNVRRLSLDECVYIALEHNFDVQITRYDPIGARYNLASQYGAYDPQFSFSAVHSFNSSPGGIDDEGRPFAGSETKNDTLASGIQGLLPWGLNYNVGGTLNDQYGTRAAIDRDPTNPITVTNQFFDPVANVPVTLLSTNFGTINTRSPFEDSSGRAGALQLSQPLLKNFFIDGVRYNIYASKKNVTTQEQNFRDQVMLMLLRLETAYYRLVSLEDGVKVQEKALELAERLSSENKKRVEVGALAPLDEQQAYSQAATTRAALIQAQADRDTAQRDLKNLLSDNYTNTWADTVIEPTDRLLAIPRIYNLQESWRDGLAQGPGVLQTRNTLDVAKYNVKYRRNQLMPQVDVVGSYGYNGSGQEFSDVLDQIGHRELPFWTVGGQFSVPLSRTAERNNYSSAKAAKEQQELVVKRMEQGIMVGIENDITEARSRFEQVDAIHEEFASAQTKKLPVDCDPWLG